MQVMTVPDIVPHEIKGNKGKKPETDEVLSFESFMFSLNESEESETSLPDFNMNQEQGPQELVEEDLIDETLLLLHPQMIYMSNEVMGDLTLHAELTEQILVNEKQGEKPQGALVNETLTVHHDDLDVPMMLNEVKKESREIKSLNVTKATPLMDEEGAKHVMKPTESLVTVSSLQRIASLTKKSDESSVALVNQQPILTQNEMIEQPIASEVKTELKWQNQVEIEQEILRSASLLKDNESSRLVLKIFPRELGSLHIELQLKDGVLSGLIQVEQHKTAELLQLATSELNQILQQVEIKVSESSTDLQQQFMNEQFHQSNNSQSEQQQTKKMNRHMMSDLPDEMEESDEFQGTNHQINLKI